MLPVSGDKETLFTSELLLAVAEETRTLFPAMGILFFMLFLPALVEVKLEFDFDVISSILSAHPSHY